MGVHYVKTPAELTKKQIERMWQAIQATIQDMEVNPMIDYNIFFPDFGDVSNLADLSPFQKAKLNRAANDFSEYTDEMVESEIVLQRYQAEEHTGQADALTSAAQQPQ